MDAHPGRDLVMVAIKASLLNFIPKAIFAYYITYYALDAIVRKKRALWYNIAAIVAALFLCIVLDRIWVGYVVVPYVYQEPEQAAILEPRRMTSSLLFMVFIAGIMIAVKSVRTQLITKEKEKNLIREKLETELKFLRNQTNPHFLLNTLNNIYALSRKGAEETPEVVMRLSELLRFMLYESAGKLIYLKDEIKVMQDYLELEMIRYNNRLSVSFNKETDSNSYQVTPMLLLPLLENAFKHGVSETRFESFINIDLKVKEGRLSFEIENSYDATPGSTRTSNIGLINTNRQLELTYSDFRLDISDDKTTFKVDLFINLESYVEI
jgi:LytS/YehU family sensor histidine kinase